MRAAPGRGLTRCGAYDYSAAHRSERHRGAPSMSQAFIRIVSRVLVASLIWLPLQAQAGLIATDRAVAAAAAQAGQAGEARQVNAARAAIAAQLESYGVPGDQARGRVAALTDEEAVSLAARVADVPAGAGAEIAFILIIAFLIWRFGFSDQAKAERGKK